MARSKGGILFTEAAGKTVASIRYNENPDWRALEVLFTDGTLYSFELSARITVDASYLEQRRGDSEIIRKYGRVSGNSGHQA
jgi:hypothetical protein